jgi:peptidoglycan/xylan/chitin deacetylase (PgdA/CDA1 family)
MKNLLLPALACIICTGLTKAQSPGETIITRWPDDKKGAVSITFDDGSVNQFKQALPVLNRLNLKATFFIITGQIPGSKYAGKFIGRPVKTIIAETATVPPIK